MVRIYSFKPVLALVCWAFLQVSCGFCSDLALTGSVLRKGPQHIEWEYVGASDTTEIKLGSGKKLFLNGRFDVRSALWGEYSLLYLDRYHWAVLEVGEKQIREIFPHDNKWAGEWWAAAKCNASGPALSADAKSCFLWLNWRKQLVSTDVASGKVATLTRLPSSQWNYKPRDRHIDPGPIWRDNGVVHDPERNRVLFLIREKSNEEVPFWEQRPRRTGGYQIVAVDLRDARMTVLSGPRKLKGQVNYWDLSLNRGRVFLSTCETEKEELQVRALDGQLVHTLPIPQGGVKSIWLSPDEQTLLVQRKNCGFALIDLGTNRISDGPSNGHSAAWSPDGRKIAYLDSWELWLYEVESRKASKFAFREPTDTGTVPGWPEKEPWYWTRPAWSPDGNMLAVNIGGSCVKGTNNPPSTDSIMDAPTLIIDLKRRIAMVFPHYITRMIWIPHPHPFHTE